MAVRDRVLALAAVVSSASACIGIEHEDIGGSGSASGETLTTSGDGDGDGDGEGEGEGESGNDGDPQLDLGADGAEPRLPRLFVGDGSHVEAFDDLGALEGVVVVPTAVLGDDVGSATSVALAGDRLLVGSDDDAAALSVYEAADALTDGAVPDFGLGAAAFGDQAFFGAPYLNVDAAGDLWVGDAAVGVWRLANVGSIDGDALPSAHFLLSGATVHDGEGLKLLGTGAGGVSVFEAPTQAQGDVAADWVLDPGAAGRPTLHGGDLWVVSDTEVRVWRDVAALTQPTEPDVTLALPNPDLTAVSHASLRGDLLVLCNDDPDDAEDRVLVYLDASALASDTLADFDVSDPSLRDPSQAIVGRDDALLVRVADGVLVFDGASQGPSLRAHIQLDGVLTAPADMALLECSAQEPCAGSDACVDGLCVP